MIEHKPLYQAMISATSQTLENMIFSEAMEHFDRSYKIPANELIWTSILINNPVQGEIILAMSKPSLKNITANIFALEIDAVEEAQTKLITRLTKSGYLKLVKMNSLKLMQILLVGN